MVTDVDMVAALLDPETWKLDAACREHPELDWVPDRGAPVAEQLAICDRCAVRSECLDYWERTPPAMPGIWGGLTARGRRAMRRGEGAA